MFSDNEVEAKGAEKMAHAEMPNWMMGPNMIKLTVVAMPQLMTIKTTYEFISATKRKWAGRPQIPKPISLDTFLS